MPLFKFKRAGAKAIFRDFQDSPRWSDLSSTISQFFDIPKDHVRVAYVDKENDAVTFNNDKQLQAYVESNDSSQAIKLVVEDVKSPDLSIFATWSQKSNLSTVSDPVDPKLRLFGWVLDKSSKAFQVKIANDETVASLMIATTDVMKLDVISSDLVVWKVSIPDERDLAEKMRMLQLKDEESLQPTKVLSEVFSEPLPRNNLHFVVRAPPIAENSNLAALARHAFRKRSGFPEIDEDHHAPKKLRTEFAYPQRKWHVNGSMPTTDTRPYYYVDPATQDETKRCLSAVLDHELVLLSGARSSGKTTRLLRLRDLLEEMGYQGLYFSFDLLNYEQFWQSLGYAIRLVDPGLDISSQGDFLRAFAAGSRERPVVLLIDELSKLDSAPGNIRNGFLQALRDIRNNHSAYAIDSIIATGTFSITLLTTTDPSVSPFNVTNSIQNPNFSIEETKKLFHMFMQDNDIVIEDAVIEDVWAKSNGHPGMVCVCGRVISKRLGSLVEHASRTLPYRNWQSIPIEVLYGEITAYATFSSMIESLRNPSVKGAVQLLRSKFAGFLDDVTVSPYDTKFADFLTAEGVLLKPTLEEPRYRTASPLIDGLIRTKVIPFQFPNAPSTNPPRRGSGTIHVLDSLVESIKFFDKDLIRLACNRSYKTSNVPVNGRSRADVPRESVYDTELMRVLHSWLARLFDWKVTGQWHLQTTLKKHRFTDIVLQKEMEPPIVLGLLATGDRTFVRSHIEKTPEYMGFLSANEGWVVHFTCEDNYHPIWQTDAELDKGVNVVHFAHDVGFTHLSMWARWKDDTGVTVLDTCNVDI